jgi:hypothetical protein
VLDTGQHLRQSAPVAVWRSFESRKTHGDDPEVIERPVGTTVLYVVLFLSGLGFIAGMVPMGEDCKLTCTGAHPVYALAIVSASVGVIAAAVLAWSRWQERHRRRER